MELGVTDPVPTFDAQAVSHQLQQGFWGRPQTGEKEVLLQEGFAMSGSFGVHLHDPAGADPCLGDVLRCLFGPQRFEGLKGCY